MQTEPVALRGAFVGLAGGEAAQPGQPSQGACPGIATLQRVHQAEPLQWQTLPSLGFAEDWNPGATARGDAAL